MPSKHSGNDALTHSEVRGFPDQSHVEKIADHLWNSPARRPGAALMVGAGLSLNAHISNPAHTMPTWFDLVDKLITDLYPGDGKNQQKQQERARKQTGAVSGLLRLAEEYEATHGRAVLNKFLLNAIHDAHLRPSELHRRLLALPWQEVFTTNWDTLLEQTNDELMFRQYSVVTQTFELTRAASPRIIKLHGSFPDIEPFIFTEEDFRTYPTKFAPFVNTVIQAMMENTLCLVGFSGDDPNFLRWAGWLRDELGSRAPQIYLCGWLGLPPGRRRLLEKMNIVPVDYAFHPEAKSGEGDRHEFALRLFVKDLAQRRRKDHSEWPRIETKKVSLTKLQEELEKTEKSAEKDQNVTDILKEIKGVINPLAEQKAAYPGWLVYMETSDLGRV